MAKKNKEDKSIEDYYNTKGWQLENGITDDAKTSEDLRNCSQEYISACRFRIMKQIPSKGINLLDMASGPIQYEEYLEYSKNYENRYCVDLSIEALNQARDKIGDHGVFLHGNFLDIQFEENFFDCSLSIHTIYHINAEFQNLAVRKLLRITKPGKPVIIIYSNPNAIIRKLFYPIIKFKKLISYFIRKNNEQIYFYRHPLKWWEQFKDEAIMEIYPWRSFSTLHMKYFIPDNILGKYILKYLFILEENYPNFFVKYFEYPMIVLIKR